MINLIHKDTTAMPLANFLYCLTFRLHITLHLGALNFTYTEAEIQSTAPHLVKLSSRKFLGNSLKITNHLFFKNLLNRYFKIISNISLKSVPHQSWNIRRANHGAKHWKIWFFLYDINNLNKNEERGASLFVL